MKRSTVLAQLPISPSDFVVEIGAGPAPFWHTKLILDKYPFDNLERHGDIVNVAPVIKADATRLPLADHTCDVLFASHVIEHIPEPWLFLEEVKRCAQRVYLEFPSVRLELMYAWAFHRWLVRFEGGQVIFHHNDIPQLFGDFFHTHYDFLLDTWSTERFEELNTSMFVQTSDLRYTVSPQSAMEYVLEHSARDEHKGNFPSRYGQLGSGQVTYPWATRMKTWLWSMTPSALLLARNRWRQQRNRAQRPPLTDTLAAHLLCQRCRAGSLRLLRTPAETVLECQACRARYTATDDVFDLDL